jgi:hypothetical protein
VVHVLEGTDTEASVLGIHMNFSGRSSMSAVICWLQVKIRLSILMLECRCMLEAWAGHVEVDVAFNILSYRERTLLVLPLLIYFLTLAAIRTLPRPVQG